MVDKTQDKTHLTTREAAQYLNVSERTLPGWRFLGRGPRWIRMGGRAIRYRRQELEAWANDHPSFQSTLEADLVDLDGPSDHQHDNR